MAIKGKNDTVSDIGENPSPDLQSELPRLFIVSDVRLVSEGLALALSQEPSVVVVGSSDLSVSPAGISQFFPNVLLLDVARPSSLDLCRQLRQVLPDVKIVAFAVAEVDREIIACAEAGVSGFVSRKGSIQELVAAVHRAARHELLCSPRTAALLFSRVAVLSPTSGTAVSQNILTRREREIVALIEKGLSNKEIAHVLRIGHATVKNHVHSILAKLQVRRRGEAAAHTRRVDLDATVLNLHTCGYSELVRPDRTDRSRY
jgi:DNA-binding NarL/FixJ family response regulator